MMSSSETILKDEDIVIESPPSDSLVILNKQSRLRYPQLVEIKKGILEALEFQQRWNEKKLYESEKFYLCNPNQNEYCLFEAQVDDLLEKINKYEKLENTILSLVDRQTGNSDLYNDVMNEFQKVKGDQNVS